MSAIDRRLQKVEEEAAQRRFEDSQRMFAGRSDEQLEHYAQYGEWPEGQETAPRVVDPADVMKRAEYDAMMAEFEGWSPEEMLHYAQCGERPIGKGGRC